MAKKGKKEILDAEEKIEETNNDFYLSKKRLIDNVAITLSLFVIGVIPGTLYFTNYAIKDWNLNLYSVHASSLMNYFTNFEFPYINPDLSFGEYNSYYPFTFFLASLFTVLTGSNIFLGFSLTRITISLASALIFYKICRYENIDKKTGIILTFIYAFMFWFIFLLRGSLPMAGAFIFIPPIVYFLYKVFNDPNPKFQIFLVFSIVLLFITSFGPLLHAFYFFGIYLIYLLLIEKRDFLDVKSGLIRLSVVLLFVAGISAFYSFFLFGISDSIAWNKILTHTSFNPSRESFIRSGINPLSLVYGTEELGSFGVVSIILFLLSLYVKKAQKRTISSFGNKETSKREKKRSIKKTSPPTYTNKVFSQLDKYLLLMFCLALIAAIFPIVFAYFPIVGHTEYGFRALPIAFFSLAMLSKDGIVYLRKKIPFFLLFVIIIIGVLTQIYSVPHLYDKEPYPYTGDIEDFYSIIGLRDSKSLTRVNYHVEVVHPLCKNCISFGAPVNYYGIVLDQPTTTLWGYIDYSQRNPTDPKVSGSLGEKYYIVKNDLTPQYIQNGYNLVKNGDQLSLLENPNSTSIFQFITENESLNLEVQRNGGWFYTKFDAPSRGILLVKFVYHPLAEVLDNGKKLEIKETDYGIMYVEMEEGAHDLRFHYRTYNYFIISIISLIALIFYYRWLFMHTQKRMRGGMK